VAAGQGVAFLNLGVVVHVLHEKLDAVPVHGSQVHQHEGQRLHSQLLFINDSRKLLDDAGFPQVFRPGQAGRGGKSDFFGKLQIGDRCVGLQLPQDRLIAVIQ